VLNTESPADALFGVRYNFRDGLVRILVHGELDLLTAPVLEDALVSVESRTEPIVVDLSDLSFMDVSGLRALALAGRRAREKGCRFAVTKCSPMVRRLLELTGMASLLDAGVPELLEAHTDG
jgi:anti-anti-sigma factor